MSLGTWDFTIICFSTEVDYYACVPSNEARRTHLNVTRVDLGFIINYTLKNKGSKWGFSQWCHKRNIFGSPKNLSVKRSEKNHGFLSKKNIWTSIKNRLCSRKIPLLKIKVAKARFCSNAFVHWRTILVPQRNFREKFLKVLFLKKKKI